MSLLSDKIKQGSRAALAAFGIKQPSLGSVGIKAPSAPGLPPPAKAPTAPAVSTPTAASSSPSVAKTAFNVGMGASNSSDGAGAQAGEPIDVGRRQRSLIDRTFQQNEDFHATSSMPLPGDKVSP